MGLVIQVVYSNERVLGDQVIEYPMQDLEEITDVRLKPAVMPAESVPSKLPLSMPVIDRSTKVSCYGTGVNDQIHIITLYDDYQILKGFTKLRKIVAARTEISNFK